MRKENYIFLVIVIAIYGIVLLVSGAWTGDLNDNIIYYYSMNHTGTIANESVEGVKNITGLVNNWTNGIIGNGHWGSTLDNGVTNINLSQFSNNFSMNFWLNRTGSAKAGFPRIFDAGSGVEDIMLRQPDTSGDVQFVIDNTGATKILLSLGRWYMITVTRNVSGYDIYVNGVHNSSIVKTNHVFAGDVFCLFNGGSSCNTENPALNIIIDEVGLWNKTLTQVNIDDLYNSGDGISYDPSITSNPGNLLIQLDYPSDNSFTSNSNLTFNATITPTDANLTNTTIYLYNSTIDLINNSWINLTGEVANISNFDILGLEFGEHTWNILACGTNSTNGTICDFATSNYTFTRQQFEVNQEFYDFQIYETENSTFYMNLTVDPSATLFSANLIYNGTPFLVETINNLGAGKYQLIREIDIPSVQGNNTKSYFWQVTLDSGSGFNLQNSTQQLQNVSDTNISTYDTTPIINYTIYDEETLETVNASFDGSFTWYLGTGTENENESYSRSRNNSFLFHTIPDFKNFSANSIIKLHNATSELFSKNYIDRTFEFSGYRFTQDIQEQELYLLSTSNGTNVIIEVKDSGLTPLENYLVTIERFYPDKNIFRMVEQQKTDAFGQFSARLIENSVRYKFVFRNPDNEIVKTLENVKIACRSSICIAQFVIEETESFFERYFGLDNYAANVSFNNNTRVFTATWNDNRGESQTHRFSIIRYLFNGTTYVFNETSIANTGSFTYTAPNIEASYTASLYRKVGNSEILIYTTQEKIGGLSDIFGREGLMWSFLLLITLIMIGSFHPLWGMVFYMVGFFALAVLDIAYVPPAILIAELVIGVLFIWAFGRKS